MKCKSFIAQFKISENWISSFKYFSKWHGFTWPKRQMHADGVKLPQYKINKNISYKVIYKSRTQVLKTSGTVFPNTDLPAGK